MNRTLETRLRKLEVRAKIDGSLQNITDDALFAAHRDLIERAGGAEAFATALRAEGEDRLADYVLACLSCETTAQFMGYGPDGEQFAA